MPLISLTQEVLDRGKLPEVGWSPAKLNSCNENKASKGDSTNYFFEFICTGGPEKKSVNTGRFITTMFNSKALALDGSRGMPDVINKFTTMAASLLGVHIDELSPDDYDTDKWVGKTCWIKIEIMPDNTGKLVTMITDFSSDTEVPF